jgi:hypothetical protein
MNGFEVTTGVMLPPSLKLQQTSIQRNAEQACCSKIELDESRKQKNAKRPIRPVIETRCSLRS